MNKKAAIELSVTTIIILIIAVVVLGLILGFLQNMLGQAAKPLEEKMGEEPDPAVPDGDEPITVSRGNIIKGAGDEEVLKVSVYNADDFDWQSTSPSISTNCGIGIANGKIVTAGAKETFAYVLTAISTPGVELCTVSITGTDGTAENTTTLNKDITIKVE